MINCVSLGVHVTIWILTVHMDTLTHHLLQPLVALTVKKVAINQSVQEDTTFKFKLY